MTAGLNEYRRRPIAAPATKSTTPLLNEGKVSYAD